MPRVLLPLLAFIYVATACGNDEVGTGVDAVVFGEGAIPESVPNNFPVPAGAVVGATLVDRANNRTEFRLTVQREVTATVQFFEVGLVNQGYVVDASGGTATEWTLRFSDGLLAGSILITPQGSLTAAVVSVNTS